MCLVLHPRQVEDLAGAEDVAKRAGEGVDEVAKRAGEGVDEVKKRAGEGVYDPVESASSFLKGQGEKVWTGTTTLFEYVSILRLN
jgi:hypothetical protein